MATPNPTEQKVYHTRRALVRAARRGMANVVLLRPKTTHNVGTAMRSCHIFGVKSLQIVGGRYKKQSSDVSNFEKRTPLFVSDELSIPFGCVPVGIEIVEGSISLERYQHPRQALYIFGPEDGSISRGVLGQCRDIVSIPGESCLNLAMAVSIVLYDREAKRLRQQGADDVA